LDSIRTKLTEEIDFEVYPYGDWRFRQWHGCSSTMVDGIIVIEPAAWRRAAIEAWGHSELGACETGGTVGP